MSSVLFLPVFGLFSVTFLDSLTKKTEDHADFLGHQLMLRVPAETWWLKQGLLQPPQWEDMLLDLLEIPLQGWYWRFLLGTNGSHWTQRGERILSGRSSDKVRSPGKCLPSQSVSLLISPAHIQMEEKPDYQSLVS